MLQEKLRFPFITAQYLFIRVHISICIVISKSCFQDGFTVSQSAHSPGSSSLSSRHRQQRPIWTRQGAVASHYSHQAKTYPLLKSWGSSVTSFLETHFIYYNQAQLFDETAKLNKASKDANDQKRYKFCKVFWMKWLPTLMTLPTIQATPPSSTISYACSTPFSPV